MDRLHRIKGHLDPNPVCKAASSASSTTASGKNVCVIVDGARTPFSKSFGSMMREDAIALGAAAVGGLVNKTKLDPNHVDQLIMGNVVMNSNAPNLAREIVIDLKLPTHIPGTTVSIACLSGLEAIYQGICQIEHGDASTVIAGGSDSLSSGQMSLPANLTLALGKYSMGGGNKKGLYAGLSELFSIAGGPSKWAPKAPAIAERSTGRTMGYHADLMAEINSISRQDQDAFAINSHKKATEARQLIRQEIVAVRSDGKVVDDDDLIRSKVNPDKVAKLKPAFRKEKDHGTVNAASSSALTDGASAVLLMSERKAAALGYPTDVICKAYVKTAVEPFPQLLLAPAVAIPRCLSKAGLTLDDIDIFEIHEAFSAQVLATLKVLESKDFAQKFLGQDEPVGKIPLSKVNLRGGSIAIGHPFAATGGRLVTTAANLLRRTKKRYALLSVCAAGGIGGVMILERRS
eukprot:CAMPEP_0197514800 /NCGR_PEP_ID=MMETSP1318-20131121/130_1 /TAXON_ID=552666 /ORGANISM="Partenskyella glossopodia, Strain RCC365" /LENGTH=460 /DNA_ID=CAMNT_0043062995 /DNA_START=15 /DNA_END=1397 /DNA_ORIENTATION=-